jgi:hypothetical protein
MSERLEYLRSQIRAESISMGEIAELQSLADQIEPGDVELLEWAGVPEFPPDPIESHKGHWPQFGGGWWCDTCGGPYCEQA